MDKLSSIREAALERLDIEEDDAIIGIPTSCTTECPFYYIKSQVWSTIDLSQPFSLQDLKDEISRAGKHGVKEVCLFHWYRRLQESLWY